jgi:uncharacterized protein (DUF1684 family)
MRVRGDLRLEVGRLKSLSKHFYAVVAALMLFTLVLLGAAGAEDPGYIAAVENWQVEQEANLKKDSSWLTVAGLYWLREGENAVGADPSNDFLLPEGSAPGIVGVFDFEDRTATFRAADGVTVTQNGEPVQTAELEMGEKHAVAINDLTMWLHYSGSRLAIRLRDLNATLRKEFTGLKWFPVDPRYKVSAKFTPYAEPKKVDLLNVLGDIESFESPGYVDFELMGTSVRMEPLSLGGGGLWFVFRDGTSGKETYPAARFLRADAPDDGRVVIDFNRSTNPPCAYNPHTTCPVPTKQNRLKVGIEAGEKNYHENHS